MHLNMNIYLPFGQRLQFHLSHQVDQADPVERGFIHYCLLMVLYDIMSMSSC